MECNSLEWMFRIGVEIWGQVDAKMTRDEEMGSTGVMLAVARRVIMVLGVADTVKPEGIIMWAGESRGGIP